MNAHVATVAETPVRTAESLAPEAAAAAHSPYLVARLANQAPNLYGTVKFAIVAEEIARLSARLGRPARVLDLGCSTSISKHYLEFNVSA